MELKKEPSKTPVVKVNPPVQENKYQHGRNENSMPDGYSKSDAAEYAKNFGRKFMMTDAWIGNFLNYTMSIHSIKILSFNTQMYAIDLTIGWNEVDGFTNLSFQYKGVFTFDQYGCDPIFFIREKEEPSLFGAGSRSFVMKEEHKEKFNLICQGVKWFRALTDGCLEKK